MKSKAIKVIQLMVEPAAVGMIVTCSIAFWPDEDGR
jgi:hypothetical protein